MKLLDRGADISDKMTDRVTKQSAQMLDRLVAVLDNAQAMREPLKEEVRSRVRERLNLGPRRTRRFTAMTLIVGTGLGYLAAYLFDPAHGATRRQRIREQVRTAARRTTQMASDQVQTVGSSVGQKVGMSQPNTTELGSSRGISARVDEVVGSGEKIPSAPGGTSRVTPTTPL